MLHYILQVSPDYESAASYNRVRLFKKGFEKISIFVSIHLIILKNESLFQKLRSLFSGYIKLLGIILSLKKEDIVIIYGETYFTFFYPLISRRAHLAIERTEYPAFIINQSLSATGFKNSQNNIKAFRHAEFLITCSSFLKEYYSSFFNKIIISPLIIDLEEFVADSNIDCHKIIPYIAYCGSFGNNKDGVPILIEAFSLVSKQYKNLNLVLIGSGPEDEINLFNAIIKKNKIEDKVIFTGSLPHKNVVGWLCQATMLALARPNNKQAEGGIPSKVGEYLASGVPCVITNVGDLPTYLKDGYDCFISEPDSAIAFASKIKQCLESDMKYIGNNAKLTVSQFNYDVQAKSLYEKISQVLSSK